MRRILAALLALLCIFAALPAGAAQALYGWTVLDDVPLFARASDRSPVLCTLADVHTPFLITSDADGIWVAVLYEDQHGYLQAADIEEITGVEAARAASTVDFSIGKTVWIPTNGGTKYHRRAGCSNMLEPQKVTMREAKDLGFAPCGRCKPGS